MKDVLFPVAEVPELIMEEETSYPYKKSIKWDMELGDFVRNGANQTITSDGLETYRTWCIKMLDSERFECLAYPNEIGVEMEEALQDENIDIIFSDIERTITECLMVNPRTEYVSGFEFDFESDEVYCSFFVKGRNYEEFEITMELNTNGRTI